MSGSARQRYCVACEREVHDFAAMTPREIERIVVSSGGHLCARITRREDGSLLTLPEPQRRHNAAFVLAATLFLAAPLAEAQVDSVAQPDSSQLEKLPVAVPPQPHPTVTGVVTDSQGSLVVGATATLLLDDAPIGSIKTNDSGEFEFAVVPGQYRLQVAAPGFASSSKVLEVSAEHAAVGDVSLNPGGPQVTIQVTASASIDTSTGGVLSVTYGPWYRRLGYHLRHPVASMRYLFHSH